MKRQFFYYKTMQGLFIFLVLLLQSCMSGTSSFSYAGDYCEDGLQDRDETDVDCGGQYCDPCVEAEETEEEEAVEEEETVEEEEAVEESEQDETTKEEDFTFIFDDGIRMAEASNPGVKMNDDGTISLLFQDNSDDGKQHVAISEDGLTFSDRGESVTQRVGGQFRAKQLPDGTWRGYGYDTTKGIEEECLTSQSSEDGITFADDVGCRYTLTDDDKGTMGVYEFFADSNENIVLLYIGDRYGLNNIRRAYSKDNGETFTFTNGNVLGDDDFGGGAKSYVDEKVLVLDDHRVFLVAMQSGTIYGFMSEDDGVSFEPYEEPLLEANDFISTEYGEATSLHDPQIIELEDGRYRIYVTAGFRGDSTTTENDTEAIVSATTE